MFRLLLALPIIAISACSLDPVANDPQFEYARANVYKNLEIPPDLTIEHDTTFSIPGIDELNSAAPDYDNVELIRNNDSTWLEITGDVNLVWSRLHDFLNLQGIKIETSDKLTGLITSEWLNNQTGITSGNLLDNLQSNFISSNYLDQYIFSVEREDDDKIKVVVIHNGLTKVVFDNAKTNSLSEKWIKASSNHALAITLLKKFMAYSGLAEKVGTAGFSSNDLANLFKEQFIKRLAKDHFIIVQKPIARVFANLETALLDTFDVEKTRKQSNYIIINEPYKFVRLEKNKSETSKKEDNNLIRIQVLKQGYKSKIVIRNDRGEAIDLATTDKLLNRILAINL